MTADHTPVARPGHDFEEVVHDKGRLFGLFTKGCRPELKQMSGQGMLPGAGADRRLDRQRRLHGRRVGQGQGARTHRAGELDVLSRSVARVVLRAKPAQSSRANPSHNRCATIW